MRRASSVVVSDGSARLINIYDPNLNPYGYELACGLAVAGSTVRWWTDPDAERPVVPGVRRLAALAGRRRASLNPWLLIDRWLGPVRFAISAGHQFALICWVRDPWDALVFGIRTRLGFPTAVVYHNPRQVRPRGGLAGRLEQWLMARAIVVVHSEWLRSLAAQDFPQAVVAPHPLYMQTVAAAGGAYSGPISERVFALVGSLRADKGVENLVPLARATRQPWTLRIIGPDVLSAEIESALAEEAVTVEYSANRPPSDAELIAQLGSATAMIAPYTAPTTSGSAYMALTLGVPVIALDSPSFAEIVPSKNRARDVPGMARVMDVAEVASRNGRVGAEWRGWESWLKVVKNGYREYNYCDL